MSTIIYALSDPAGEIRYIGKTSMTLARRLRGHIQDTQRGINCHRSNWIRSLLAANERPTILELETVEDCDGTPAECFWIAQGRGMGWRLTNGTIGGDGGATRTGYITREETKRRQSAAKLGKPRSPETCKKISASKQGRPGYRHTAESKAKIGAGNRGKRLSEAHKAALRKPKSDATKAKLRASVLAYYRRKTDSDSPSPFQGT